MVVNLSHESESKGIHLSVMLALQNQKLRVMILDPISDRQRLGSRYCTGGYIWQISDQISGDLFSGPMFPNPSPTQFDGQGAPEVFETALGLDDSSINETVLVIGVGEVVRSSPVQPFHVRDNPMVKEFCTWEIEQRDNSFSMRTTHKYKKYSLQLTRIISLIGKTVTSKSVISNCGEEPIPLRWFAHPFFPLNNDLVCSKFSRPYEIPDNPGFFLDKDGYLAMREEYAWEKGLYCPLKVDGEEPMIIRQRHPILSVLEVKLNFPVSSMPFWANANTFSFEPYLNTTLVPDSIKEWSIEYLF